MSDERFDYQRQAEQDRRREEEDRLWFKKWREAWENWFKQGEKKWR